MKTFGDLKINDCLYFIDKVGHLTIHTVTDITSLIDDIGEKVKITLDNIMIKYYLSNLTKHESDKYSVFVNKDMALRHLNVLLNQQCQIHNSILKSITALQNEN